MTKDQELVEKIRRRGIHRKNAEDIISLCRQHFRTATLDGVRPEVERMLTDETVIANCINLETLNKAIDNLRGKSDE